MNCPTRSWPARSPSPSPIPPDIPDNAAGAVGFNRFTADGTDVDGFSSSFAVRSTIDTPHDRDWFRVGLSSDTTYRIDLEGQATGQGTLSDPLVRLFDADGNEVVFDDDGGVGFNAVLFFTPSPAADGSSSFRTYFNSAESFGEATGTYRLVMQSDSAAPPPGGRSLRLADLLDHDPGVGAHGPAPAPRAAAGPDAGSADAAASPAGGAPLGEALTNLLGGAGEQHVI